MTVHVVTDSTADLPPDLARSLGVTVVPLNVHFGQESYQDGVDLSAEAFYARLTSGGAFPKTSQPSLAAFADVYKRLASDGQPVISLHISSKLSGTAGSATQARELSEARVPIEVVDTGLVSLALGTVVIAVAEAARAGQGLAQLASLAKDASSKTRAYALLDTLEYLEKGGRIGKAQAFLGSLLKVKPIVEVKQGEVHPVERVRSWAKGIESLGRLLEAAGQPADLGVMYSTDARDAEALVQRISSRVPRERIRICRFGPVLGAYVGPGAIGMAVRTV